MAEPKVMEARLRQPELMGTGEVALRLRLSAERVRQLEAAGKLQAWRTGAGRRVFLRDDVERLAQERR